MHTYRVEFRVNAKRSQQDVKALNSSDAKKLIQAQYAGQKVTVISCRLMQM